MDDQRLTTGTSRRLRATLPLALLSISAQLAVQAAESGASAEAKRHLRIMQESGFGAGVIDEALQRTIEPIRQRIKALCQNAPAEADADAVHADAVTRRFLDQAGALLSVLDCLLPAEHPTRQAMGDEVALTALRCQISYGNKTEDWQVSLELLQRTLPVAAGKAARERIQQNIRIVEGNRQVSMCWFCGKRRPDDGSGVEVKMYGNVQRTPVFTGGRFGTRLQWQQATIKVPRCTQCASAHSRVETFTGIGAVLGGVAGLAGCAAVASGEGQNAACGALGVLALLTSVGAGIGYGVGRASFPAGIKPVDAKIEFPVIVDKKKEGWQVGEKPSEANS